MGLLPKLYSDRVAWLHILPKKNHLSHTSLSMPEGLFFQKYISISLGFWKTFGISPNFFAPKTLISPLLEIKTPIHPPEFLIFPKKGLKNPFFFNPPPPLPPDNKKMN